MYTHVPLILAQAETVTTPPSETAPPSLPDAAPVAAPTGVANDGVAGSTSTSSTSTQTGDLPPDPGPLGGSGFFVMMLLAIVAFMFFSFRSQSKQKKQREAMLSSLEKGARVSTIGGILGTVIDVRDNEVVLKVDENANTKIHFSRSSIQNVITKDE